MTSIISPLVFYVADVCGNLSILFTVLSALTFVLIIVNGDKAGKWSNKELTVILCIFVSFVSLAVFIPSKETCYKMVIAQYVTENNIKLVQDKAEASVEYLFQKIDEMVSKHLEGRKK